MNFSSIFASFFFGGEEACLVPSRSAIRITEYPELPSRMNFCSFLPLVFGTGGLSWDYL